MSYGSKEEAEEMMREMVGGLSTRPPGGSVFQTMHEQEKGPPMMRMLVLQACFSLADRMKMLTKNFKMVLIIVVVFGFMLKDLINFHELRRPNIYEQIGLTRAASVLQIEEAFAQHQICLAGEPGCLDIDFAGPIFKLNATEIGDIKYVLTKPSLRELYDKTETFVRKKYDPKFVPSEGQRYFSALSEVSSYSMYVIIMFLFVETHQNFAKQMTISTLILFATISVQLKMPRLGTSETQVVQLINRIPFLDRFCYFEINYLIK